MTKSDKGQAKEMTFWDHLDVLRGMLFRVLIVYVCLLIACFAAMPHIFDSFVLGPSHGDFFVYRILRMLGSGGSSGMIMPDFSGDFNVDIININVASQFLTHISTSLWLSLILVFPYLIFEIWKFIRPALYKNEIRGVRAAFAGGSLLFYIGCAVGYCIVFPLMFRFLTQYTIADSIANQISLNSYISTFVGMIFVMGVVFEIPVVCWILSVIGLIRKGMLKQYRKYAVVVLIVLAALITPSGDPFTLTVVFLPLYLLYELSILIVKS